MKSKINKRRMIFFLMGFFIFLTMVAFIPQVSATVTSTEGDGWADVDTAWFAKTRHGGAGGFRASIGIDATTPSGQDGYFTGGWTWISGTSYHFELVYTSSTDLAELYVDGQNGGSPICQYSVGPSNRNIGINARSAPETGMTTSIQNIKYNGMSVSPDDSVTATSLSGESAVRHLLLEGADLTSDFTIEGDFIFTYDASTNDECPSMVIDVENNYDRNCTIHFVTPFRGVDGDLSGWSTNNNMVNLSIDEWSLLNGNATVKGYTREKNNHFLTQRGNRGLGLNGYEDDEVDSYGRPEVIEISFDFPHIVDYIQVRSLFDESWGVEEGEIELWFEDIIIETIHLVGTEPIGGGNTGLVGTEIIPPKLIDKIIFWVPPNEPYTAESEFAVAKVNVTPVPCTPICRNVEDNIEYCTIQDAIDAATTDDGETIEVYAGTHIEQVDVYKNLTIYGQGIGSTTIQSPDILTHYFATSNNNYPVVYIHDVDDVVLMNLTVDGAGKGNDNYRFVGIGIYEAGSIVKDVEIIGVRDTPFSGAQHGVAIYGWSTSTTHDLTIKDCFIYDYQKTGIALGGSGLTIDVNNCEVTGVGPTTITAQNGIQVSNEATGSLTENTVSGCSYTGASWAASGILPYLSGGVLEISDNTIFENQANIYLCSCSADIMGNTIYASASGTGQTYFYGIIGDPGDPPIIPDASPLDDGTSVSDKTTYVITCEDNIVTGDGSSGGVGIGVYAGMYGTYDIDFTAIHNNVLDWGLGFELYEYAPNNLITANINYNNIIGNDYAIYNWLSTYFDVTCNWYGDISGPAHSSNPSGVGDPISDNLTYIPWLNLPFENPETVCEVGLCQDVVYIDDDFSSSTPGWYIDHFSNIQLALDRLEMGGTAIIYDGIYNEEVFIDDDFCDNTGITVKGAYDTFPLQESALLLGNMTISVSDVTIQYLEFLTDDSAAITVKENITGTLCEFNKFSREECDDDAVGIDALDNSIVDAEFNWWDTPDGPFGGTLDNGELTHGNGVLVFGLVHVEPWIGIRSIAEINPLHMMIGDPIIFDASDSFGYDSNGDPLMLSYLWDFGDGMWSMEEETGYSYDEKGTFYGSLRVSANDLDLWPNTMFDYDYFSLVVNKPGETLTANADGNDLGEYEGIVDEPIRFYGTAFGGVPGYSFEWNVDGQTLTGQTVEYCFENEGTYTLELTVTDSELQSAKDMVTVTIYGIDDIVASAGGPYDAVVEELIRFNGKASGGVSPHSYTWDFGDGSSPVTARNPIHDYSTEGSYTVTLTVTDANGNTDQSTATVTIHSSHGNPEICQINGGLGIQAMIIASDLPVDWEISLHGNFLIGQTRTTGSIAPYAQESAEAKYVFGLGPVDITIKANDVLVKRSARIIGPFIFAIQ